MEICAKLLYRSVTFCVLETNNNNNCSHSIESQDLVENKLNIIGTMRLIKGKIFNICLWA